jgi:IPT/TIG domain
MRRIAVGGTALAAVATGAIALAAPGIAAASKGGAVFAAGQALAKSTLAESASPVVLAVTPDEGTTFGGTKVTIAGEGFVGATSVDFGTTTVVLKKPSKSNNKIKVAAPPGSGTVDVTVNTPEATSPITTADRFTYQKTPPVVLKLSPDHGLARGYRPLTIGGENLTGASAVYIDGIAAPEFTVKSSKAIKLLTPTAISLSPVEVTVVTPEGSSAASAGSEYHYESELPAVEELTPSSGPAAGGTEVVVSGEGMLEASRVTFGHRPASSFRVLDDDALEVLAPPDTVSKAPVQVTTPRGTSPEVGCRQRGCLPLPKFEYNEPTITAVEPDNGPLAGGTPVTFRGTGFSTVGEETEMYIDHQFVDDLECPSIELCTGVTPPGKKLGSQPVIVKVKTNAPAMSKESESAQFTYE